MADGSTNSADHRGRSRARAGILHPSLAEKRIDVDRASPPPELAQLVDYLWSVRWHAPEPHVQEVIPRPVVHISAEYHQGRPRLLVNGVMRRRFERVLVGDGRTVAAAFRPGCFRPVLGSSVGALVDRIVPTDDLLGTDNDDLARELLDPTVDIESAQAMLADWLISRGARPDALSSSLADLIEVAESDTTIVRADQLATLAGVSLRTLQRHFTEHVGVGPKWVVQRFRLLDVAAAAHADGPVEWARLAVDLGYTDQSHLIRAFTALVGRPPGAYAAHA